MQQYGWSSLSTALHQIYNFSMWYSDLSVHISPRDEVLIMFTKKTRRLRSLRNGGGFCSRFLNWYNLCFPGGNRSELFRVGQESAILCSAWDACILRVAIVHINMARLIMKSRSVAGRMQECAQVGWRDGFWCLLLLFVFVRIICDKKILTSLSMFYLFQLEIHGYLFCYTLNSLSWHFKILNLSIHHGASV